MIITFTEKNKFGGFTHEIKINPLYFFKITETSPISFIVELVERGIFSKKVHHARTSGETYDAILMEVMSIFMHESVHSNIGFSQTQAEAWLAQFFSFVESKKENLKLRTILQFDDN